MIAHLRDRVAALMNHGWTHSDVVASVCADLISASVGARAIGRWAGGDRDRRAITLVPFRLETMSLVRLHPVQNEG
jgi:hypothetical protein